MMKLSGEGPQGSIAAFVEWVLVNSLMPSNANGGRIHQPYSQTRVQPPFHQQDRAIARAHSRQGAEA